MIQTLPDSILKMVMKQAGYLQPMNAMRQANKELAGRVGILMREIQGDNAKQIQKFWKWARRTATTEILALRFKRLKLTADNIEAMGFKKFCEYIKKRWVDKEARRFLARLETTALLKQGIRRKIGPMNKGLACVLAFKITHFPVETFALPYGITEVTLINSARLFTMMVEVFADRLISRMPVDFASFLKGLDFYYVDYMDWRLPNLVRITQKYKEMLTHLYAQYDRNYKTPFVLNILLEIRAYRLRFREYCGAAALFQFDVEVIARGFLNMPPVQPVPAALALQA